MCIRDSLNTALYEKMATEQEKYRDWLKSQPPEEILHHTYEYTVREDIVMAMEELELTDAQAKALLELALIHIWDRQRTGDRPEKTGQCPVYPTGDVRCRADRRCRDRADFRSFHFR